MTPQQYQTFVQTKFPKVCNGESLKYLTTSLSMGVGEEAGEVVGLINKVLHYGKNFDRSMLREELGDLVFYAVGLAAIHGISFEEILAYNQIKLNKRSAEGTGKENFNGYSDL